MAVEIHVALNWLFEFARLTLPIFLCSGAWVPLWEASSDSQIFLVGAVLGPIALLLAWYVLPIRCIREGCAGRMHRCDERISFWTVRTVYRCEDCGAVHQADICSPNLEITYGDW